MNISILIMVIIAIADLCRALTKKDLQTAKEFFFDFGYTDSLSPSKASFAEALGLFRTEYGISATGDIEEADLAMINNPKCATPSRPDQQIRINIDGTKIFEKPFQLEEKDLTVPSDKELNKIRKMLQKKIRKSQKEMKKKRKKELREQKKAEREKLKKERKDIKKNKKSKRDTLETVLGISRLKRQVLHGHDHSLFQCYGTSARPMTWCLANCLSNFCDVDGMRNVVQRAFDWWASQVSLNFEEIRCPGMTGFWGTDCGDVNVCKSADFVIAFTDIDGSPTYNTLAVACVQSTQLNQPYCIKPGYVLMDALEGNCPDGTSRWKLESCPLSCGWNYYTVLTHEIGHILGFEHEVITDCNGSIMNPVYRCTSEDADPNDCTKEQLLDCYDQGLCNVETKDRAAPQVTWCLANCLCDGSNGGFCDMQGIREEINKAMQWWATRSGTIISEICCPGGAGGFWKNDCNDINVCLDADIVISFNKALDGPGGELVRHCQHGAALDGSVGCTQHGIIFFDSTEGACPDGSSKWVLRSDECPSASCPGSISFYHHLLGTIGRVIGFSDVPSAAPCTNSVMDPSAPCRTDQPFMDSCLQAQITARGGMKPFPANP